MHLDRHSADAEFLEKYLDGCVVSAGDSTLNVNSGEELVHVAVVHDSSGFHPTAAISVSTSHVDEALQDAHSALTDFLIEHYPCHVKELKAEYGKEGWIDVLTESFDGMTWTLPVRTAASSICADRFAHRFVDIDAV